MSLNLSCGGAQADTTTFKAEKRMKIYFNQVKQIQMMLNSFGPAVNGKYTWKSYPAAKTFEDASPNQGPVGKTK